jgi:hypothetical protein
MISVSGGSGTYVSATASQGAMANLGNGQFTYTAPTSAISAVVTITITDSNGLVGYTYLTLSGVTSTGTSATGMSCEGTYDTNISGIAATLYLVSDAASSVSGFINMLGYYYPVIGSCTVGGALSLQNLPLSQTYSGAASLASTGQVSLGGYLYTSGGSTYTWAALSRSAAVTVTTPASSCEGTYTATIASNSGTLTLVEDGNGSLAGSLYLSGYYYAIIGSCSGLGGSITMTNLTTGSSYSGTINAIGMMNGTFTTGSATYSWSAYK